MSHERRQRGKDLDHAGEARALAVSTPESLVGRRLGPFRVDALLGSGGMGEVYRASDTRLGRTVALKVLPGTFGDDPERRARFAREAQAVASLNHPNVAAIYGLEDSGGAPALVMEYVQGTTLRTPLAVDRALEVSRQIAEGLEAAHERGIVHRDLKPANVMIASDGTVKILDFGLAKVLSGGGVPLDGTHDPSITDAMSRPAVALGTAAYMSPEQASAKPLDRRTDIWAFGCILYECLTGKRAFAGETTTDVLAAILKEDPDWGALPAETPARAAALLRRCLQKDPRQRLRDIGDARLELEEALRSPGIRGEGIRARTSWRLVAVVAAAALAFGLGAVVLVWQLRMPVPGPVARMQIDVSPARQLGWGWQGRGRPTRTTFALLPDGRAIVFSGYSERGAQLYLRSLDRWEAVPIPGTEGGRAPFVSPDGKWIGFYADSQIKKVQVHGGTAAVVCDFLPPSRVPTPVGASWGPDGTIFLADDLRLLRVPAGGGKLEVLLAPDPAKGEVALRLPHVLPGGRALLFSTQTSSGNWANPRVEVLSLDTGARKILLAEGADARYASSGHLVFVRQGTLCAVPFDPSRLEVKGPSVALVDDVMQATNAPNSGSNSFAGQFSVSDSGTLAYVTGGPYPDPEGWLLWVDSRGAAQPVLPALGPYLGGRLSPDGRSVAYCTNGKHNNIHVVDRERGTSMRLTAGETDQWPVWTPDGKRVTFSRDSRKILWTPAAGTGEPEILIESKNWILPSSWSPRGDLLAYVTFGPNSSFDVGILRVADRHAEPFLATRFSETHPEFSPDGRWLAYVSDVSGVPEVYVESFPDRGQKIKISTGEGDLPCWSRDGSRLYYCNGPIVTVVDAAARPRFGIPRTFLDCFGYAFQGNPIRSYDVGPDGRLLATGLVFGGKPIWRRDYPDARRISQGESSDEERARLEQWLRSDPERRLAPEVLRRLRRTPVTRIHIIENWMEELKRLVRPGKE